MGMDYSFAGTASYPRFDRELCALAKACGGMLSNELQERKDSISEGSISHWFGFMSGTDKIDVKFVFPPETDERLVHWFNNVYNDFSVADTAHIAKIILAVENVEDISYQICYELKMCWQLSAGWHIS